MLAPPGRLSDDLVFEPKRTEGDARWSCVTSCLAACCSWYNTVGTGSSGGQPGGVLSELHLPAPLSHPQDPPTQLRDGTVGPDRRQGAASPDFRPNPSTCMWTLGCSSGWPDPKHAAKSSSESSVAFGLKPARVFTAETQRPQRHRREKQFWSSQRPLRLCGELKT